MDVVVYPRLSLRITELVTPLKPLEAMALGKAVLGSGVGGIRELIDSEVTGSLFEPGNVGDFCAEAARLLGDERLRSALGTSARLKVCEESDWRAIASRYSRVYEAATEAFHELD
jgi:glycosyltransferase involved in cell wall biosynthesis